MRIVDLSCRAGMMNRLDSPQDQLHRTVTQFELVNNSFVVHDGLASIRRGFTLPEVRALVRAAAPIHPTAICRHLPSRFVITGETATGLHPAEQGR